MHLKQLVLILTAIVILTGCASNKAGNKFDNISSVEQALRAGDLGKEIANEIKKEKNLGLNEVVDTKILYNVFSFNANSVGYTVLAENDRLVLLCSGFGSGPAKNFKIKKDNGKYVLTYKFNVGYGVNHELSGSYTLGSGYAKWDFWPESETGFGIYLEENGQLVISDKHIKTYYRDTHEIELSAEGIKKIKILKKLYMKEFVVKVNDKEIYKGKFWSRASSAIYPGVIINDVLFSDNGKVKIDFGYPSPQYAKGKDPRNNPEIIDCFEEKGILR